MNMNKKYRLSRPSKRSFAELFFPARPKQLWSRARAAARTKLRPAVRLGVASATNRAYVKWLEKESMLATARKQARTYSGSSRMWQNPYAKPRPRAAVKRASVWYTAYPVSTITRPGESILHSLADDGLWSAFETIGIKGLHTGPMKIAGGIKGWQTTPTVDGHFDRISNKIDPLFGTASDFRRLTETATRHNGVVIDDLIPGHTGKGPDFRLAEMNYRDYPGIYHMVQIDPSDWHLLPDIPGGKDSVNIDPVTEERLKQAGYIVGKLQRVIFYEPGIKETNWSATRPIRGVDGVKRRWVYLHYFKGGQPSINWLDPTFAGMRMVIGDALHSIDDLGASGLRLDANAYLGLEKSSDDTPAWSEGHPLSEAANHIIGSMVRKRGGFTFQELNLPIEDMKAMSEGSADLSYDFISRPAYHHALATGDTEFLRLMLNTALERGIDPASLVHALQNHDELTTELVHFMTIHKDDTFHYQGRNMTGADLRILVRREIREALTGKHAPYNMPYTENGISCTTASVIAATLGYTDESEIDTIAVERIRQAHLLLAMFNAFQPGIFALSGWDLVGAFTLNPTRIESLLAEGDTRWINRGAYDMMGYNPTATASSADMPRAAELYGSLPQQLQDPNSFASQLKQILAVREQYGIATSHQLEIPNVEEKGLLAMIHRLPNGDIQVTALNFSDQPIDTIITSDHLPLGALVTDMLTNQAAGQVNGSHTLQVVLPARAGTSLLAKAS